MLSTWTDPFAMTPTVMFDDPFFFPTSGGNRMRGQRGDQRLAQGGQGGQNMMGPLRWDFNQLLNTPLTPALREEEKQYVLEISRPQGLKKEDLKLDVNEGVLTIHGEHKDEHKDDKSGRVSSNYTKFSRSMTLPENVDETKISATMGQDGKLHMVLPKLEGADKKRHIQIA